MVYRNYATLFFVMVIDSSESVLASLDLIQVGFSSQRQLALLMRMRARAEQVIVEALDKAFHSQVCELDLIFNPEKGALRDCSSNPGAQPRCMWSLLWGNFCSIQLRLHAAVYHVLDEIVMAGLVFETSAPDIMRGLKGAMRHHRATEALAPFAGARLRVPCVVCMLAFRARVHACVLGGHAPS